MSLWSRTANVLRARRVNRELDEELQFHLEARTRELMAEVLAESEARARARGRLGHSLRLREQSRDVKLLPWLESIVRDTRFAIRALRKHVVVTGAALVSLALAVGACLAAFSVIDTLILRPRSVHDPDRLIYLTARNDDPAQPDAETFNDPLFRQLRDAGRGTVDLFAMSTQVLRPVTFDSHNLVSGTATGLPSPADVKAGTLDPKSGALMLQLGKVGDAKVRLTLNGAVKDGKATGTFTGDAGGTFSLTRQPWVSWSRKKGP